MISPMRNHTADKAANELRDCCNGRAVNPRYFLNHYWQKRPLLVRQAFASWRDPITRDALAGLACEAFVESRLVMERGGPRPWHVRLGPQRAAQLRKLPPSHWTLLVQGVDQHVAGVAALLQPFEFIPAWRIDDVMISFAPRGGTVGPHIDSYDVFLIQGQGRRRWRIDSQAPPALRPGLDLRILKQFHAEADWILQPGDMLYLPPNLAHYGVALEECLTYSIGFRAPSAGRLWAAVQERLGSNQAPERYYRDPQLKATQHPGEIPRTAIEDLRRLLESTLTRIPGRDFDHLVGELLTEPKGSPVFPSRKISATHVAAGLRKGHALLRIPGSRIGFIRQGGRILLFVNGRQLPLRPSLSFAGPLLTRPRQLDTSVLVTHLQKSGFLSLLTALVKHGVFRLKGPES